GATDLSPEAVQAITQIKDNCGTPDAMVFGGSTAIPPGAISTLDALLGTVYEFAGVNRFDTARKVARSVFQGDGGLPSVTVFPDAASAGTDLDNTVFLAEGRTGADALSVGPFAADNSV